MSSFLNFDNAAYSPNFKTEHLDDIQMKQETSSIPEQSKF